MTEEQKAEPGQKEHMSGGTVFLVLVALAVAATAGYFVGSRFTSVEASTGFCECKCEMPKCPEVKCPAQVLVQGEYSIVPIRESSCRCEAWCAGGGEPACRIMRPGDVGDYAPDNVTCEEN